MAGYRIGQTVKGYKIVGVVTEGNYAASYKAQKGGKMFFLKEYIDPTDTSPDFKAFIGQQDAIYSRLRKTKLKCVEDMHESFVHEFRYHQVKPFYKAEDLKDYLVRNTDLDDRLFLCRNWLGVMRELKSNGLVHQDLKPEQILMVEEPRAKRLGRLMVFADFDWAIVDGKGMKPVMTPGYATPEHLMGGALPDFASDLFQTGVVLYEILTTTLPFGKPNHKDPADLDAYRERIQAGDFVPVCKIQPVVPSWCGEIVAEMLKWSKAERPTIEEVIAAWDAKTSRPTAVGIPAPTMPEVSSTPNWIRLCHSETGLTMTFDMASVAVTRIGFFGAFRGVLSPSGKQVAAYLPSDDKTPLFVVARDKSSWRISAPASTKNYALLNGKKIDTSLSEIHNKDRLEIFSSNEGVAVGGFLFEV